MHEDVVAAGAFVQVIGVATVVSADGATGGGIEPDVSHGTTVVEGILRIINVDVISPGVAVEVALDAGEMASALVGTQGILSLVHGNRFGNGIAA